MNRGTSTWWRSGVIGALALAGLVMVGCASGASDSASHPSPRIVVTYSVLGSLVKEVVGTGADVTVLMPNGANPHEWSPSARDVEAMLDADLVIDNGLGLEGNLQKPLNEAKSDGVPVFTVADHVMVRNVKPGEGADSSDPDQAPGADDPHVWTDPLTMRQWVDPLVSVLAGLGIDAKSNGAKVESDLSALSSDVDAIVARIPSDRRRLVTGHESMGYFAERYGFELIGAIVGSVTSQAEASAGELADLSAKIRSADVPAVFAEIGTSAATVEAIASDTGTKLVQLSTHNLPDDGTYRSFILNIATTIADALSA